jgi:hypothetical protein
MLWLNGSPSCWEVCLDGDFLVGKFLLLGKKSFLLGKSFLIGKDKEIL